MTATLKIAINQTRISKISIDKSITIKNTMREKEAYSDDIVTGTSSKLCHEVEVSSLRVFEFECKRRRKRKLVEFLDKGTNDRVATNFTVRREGKRRRVPGSLSTSRSNYATQLHPYV